MTVSSLVSRINLTASPAGTQTTFPFTFKVFDETDLYVYVAGVLKALTTDYTIPGTFPMVGGNVVFGTAITANASVVIVRILPLTQLTDYVEGDPFAAETHEDALDRLVMLAQQFDELSDRIVALSVTSLLTGITLPDPIVGGELFRWNAAMTDLELVTIGLADALNVITTQGDIIIGGAGGIVSRLGTGTANQILKSGGAGANPSWGDDVGALLTVRGDILFRNATVPAKLAAGTSGQLLQTKGTTADPVWVTRLKRILFPASCFESRAAAGWANFAQVQGTNLDFGEFQFDKTTDEKIISPPFRLTNWDGGAITIRIGWKTVPIANDCMWVVSFMGSNTTTPEAWDAAFTDHALTASTAPGTTLFLKEKSVTIAGASLGELANNDAVVMKITRDANAGGDTLDDDAKLLYVELEYSEV